MSTLSSSGAIEGGFDYQFLVAWTRILSALLPNRGLVEIGLEAVDAGNVDDVTVRYDGRRPEFTQVKYAVDARQPVNVEYLTDVPSGNATSILQKFHRTWRELPPGDERPVMQLVTNRSPDHEDALFTKLSGRTSRLNTALQSDTKKIVTIRAGLAEHLDVSQDELIEMFCDLEFLCGWAYPREERHAADLMSAHGMKDDESSIRLGVDRVRRWVLDGQRALTTSEVLDGIARLELQVAAPALIFLVQGIDWDPHVEDATEVLDWVDLYEGDTAPERRSVRSPDAYDAVMRPQLDSAAARLVEQSPSRVLVRGAMRLPAAFAVGAALPQVRGIELSVRQGLAVWSTDDPCDLIPELKISTASEPGTGASLAIAVAVNTDPTPATVRYVDDTGLEVASVVKIAVGSDLHDQVVAGGSVAVGLAQAIRNAIRDLIEAERADAVHLFLTGPAALALDLGHRWNRMADTTVYEDLGAGLGYSPAFLVRS